MTKHSAKDITRFAVETAVEEMRREGLDESAPHFLQLLRESLEEHERRIVVTVITPNGDGGSLPVSLVKFLEKQYKRPVFVRQEADPHLLGGAVILFGDERIDVSLRGTLESFARSLTVPDTVLSPSAS
jgi:F0F1-type ATP synthase delta subunit